MHGMPPKPDPTDFFAKIFLDTLKKKVYKRQSLIPFVAKQGSPGKKR